MERSSWETTVLPLVYELNQLRQQYPFFHLIVLIIELGFITLPLFSHFQNRADPLFNIFVNAYREYFAQTKVLTNIVGYLSLSFIVLLLTTFGFSLTQIRWSEGRFLQNNMWIRLRSTLIAAYFLSEILVLPAFVLTINNLCNLTNSSIINLNIVVLPFLLIFMLADRERRLFKWKLALLGCIELVFNGWIRSAAWAYLSFHLALKENHLFQRVIYSLVLYWQILNILLDLLNETVKCQSLLITIIIITGIVTVFPHPFTIKSYQDQNDYLLKMQRKLRNDEELTHEEKLNITMIAQIFKQQLSEQESERFTKQIGFQAITEQISHQSILLLLQMKLSIQCQKYNCIVIRIQKIYCQLSRNAFSIQVLYDIQTLVQQIQLDSSLSERYRMFSLINYVQKKFLKKEDYSNANVIIQVEKQIQRFYNRIMGVTALMLHFWDLQQKNRLNEDVMLGLFEQVLRMEQQMQNDIELISSHGSSKKERIILNSLMKLTSNNHVHLHEPNAQNIGFGGTNYLLIQQSKVLGISSQIINQLNISKQDISDLTTEDVFPKIVCRYINDHLDSLVEGEMQHEEESIVLPVQVARDRSYIVPFKARLQILPELLNGVKFLIHFLESSPIQNTPSMLYSPSLDRILLISPNFSSHFSLVHEPYLYEQFAHQIFGIDLVHVLQSQYKEGEPIYCELTLKNHSVKGQVISRRKSRAVVLKVAASYSVGDERLLLVQVFKKDDFDHPDRSRITFGDLLNGCQQSPSQEKRNRQRDINSTFCRIPNPFENIIDEKISKMNEFYRFSYLKIILFLFAIIIIATLGANILLSIRVDETAQSLVEVFNSNIDKNNQITNTYLLFSQSSILHQLITYPEQFLQIAKYNIQAQIEDYKKKVSTDIQILKLLQLSNVIRDNRTYQLEFDHFNITASTKSTNMYDFMMFGKQSIVTGDIRPLVLNWPAIATIIASYSSFSLQNLSDFISFQLMVFISSLSAIIIALICVNVVALRIRSLTGRILSLYEGINEETGHRFIHKFQQFANVLYTCNYFRSNHKRRQMQTNKHLNHQNVNRTLLDLQGSIEADINLELCDSNIEISSSVHIQQRRPIPRSSMVILLCRQNVICWFPLAVIGFFMSYYLQIQKYQLQATNILTYSDQMQRSCSYISYQASSFLMSSLQELLPLQKRIQSPIFVTRSIMSEFTADLPLYYEEYKKTQQQILNYDLCSYTFLNTGSLYRDIVCQDVLKGIMTRGYAETLTMYVDLVTYKSGTPMKQFAGDKRVDGKYPIFMEIYYIRRTVYNVVTYLQNIFNQTTLTYIDNWNTFLKFVLKLGWFLLPLFLILGGYYFAKAYKRCKLGLKCFLVLPKSFLLQMKITKILRQNEILNQIDWLAL